MSVTITLDTGKTLNFSGTGGSYTVLDDRCKVVERGYVKDGKPVVEQTRAGAIPQKKRLAGVAALYPDRVEAPKPTRTVSTHRSTTGTSGGQTKPSATSTHRSSPTTESTSSRASKPKPDAEPEPKQPDLGDGGFAKSTPRYEDT